MPIAFPLTTIACPNRQNPAVLYKRLPGVKCLTSDGLRMEAGGDPRKRLAAFNKRACSPSKTWKKYDKEK